MSGMAGDTDRGPMRASDADRDAVAERLRAALDEGRLGLGDYDERLRDAYAAKTYGELDRLTADLPAVPPQMLPAAPERAVAKRKDRPDEWLAWLGAGLIMIAIWGGTSIASGEVNYFWPAIPLGIWAAVLLASALGGSRRH